MLSGDDLEPLTAFCETLDASPSTVLRWVVEGLRTPRGRVCLEAIVEADGWRTTAAAVARFRAAIAGTMPRPAA
jgi:hypothetical protein